MTDQGRALDAHQWMAAARLRTERGEREAQDQDAILDALAAVLALHRPHRLTGWQMFRRALAHQLPYEGQICLHDQDQIYPCATVRAVSEALEQQG